MLGVRLSCGNISHKYAKQSGAKFHTSSTAVQIATHTRPAHFFWRLWNIFCSFPASYSSSPSNRLKRHLGHKSVCTHCLFSMHCRCFTWTERNKITQSMSWDEFVIDHYFDHKSNLFWHHYESWTNHIFFPITFEIAFNLRHFVQLLGAIWEPNQPWEPHLPS